MSDTAQAITIFWFRRDIRLVDNLALGHALAGKHPVLPLFIFDTEILEELPQQDARVQFIHGAILELKTRLEAQGSSILVRIGEPVAIWKKILSTLPVKQVFFNSDFEPYGRRRDEQLKALLQAHGVQVFDFCDHLIFKPGEIVKSDGSPYTVFTPYSKKWLERLSAKSTDQDFLKPQPFPDYRNFLKTKPLPLVELAELGFRHSTISIPPAEVSSEIITAYRRLRDFPNQDGTSRLGIHLRFGTISIRQLVAQAVPLSEVFLNQLIWREFFTMILWHFPEVVGQPFRPKFERIPWLNDEAEFEKWCQGLTGYPLVDAGMRQLNQTGYMHNRVRMIVASFLSKHLLIDWRWGEAYFARQLLDFELASNNGSWQWAAGCGTDAAPYFRIFNPIEQQKKFDPEYRYIRKWVPEFDTPDYPPPMVEHTFARKRCIEVFGQALK
jgi:deoxyribodipyrimidine photo-lyase